MKHHSDDQPQDERYRPYSDARTDKFLALILAGAVVLLIGGLGLFVLIGGNADQTAEPSIEGTTTTGYNQPKRETNGMPIAQRPAVPAPAQATK